MKLIKVILLSVEMRMGTETEFKMSSYVIQIHWYFRMCFYKAVCDQEPFKICLRESVF